LGARLRGGVAASATRFRRGRQVVEARQHVIPLLAAFFLGFGVARACYPLVRRVVVRGPLAELKLAVLEAHRASGACCDLKTSPSFAVGDLMALAAGVLSLSCLVQELRRRSGTRSLLRNQLYRGALLAFTASFFVPWLLRGEVGMKVVEILVGAAGAAMVAGAWPRWSRGTRLEAMALFLLASSLAVIVGYYIDSLVLKG
jgi:hypothetical protein